MGLKNIVLPDLGEGIIEGEILKIKVSKGDKISMDQVLLEVMTDKASMEVPSSISGKVHTVDVAEGDIVAVGSSLFTVETEGGISQTKEQKKEPSQPVKKSPPPAPEKQKKTELKNSKAEFSLSAPATRKLAEELDISLKNVSGQGSQGAVRREDLIKHIKDSLTSPHKTPSSATPPKNIEEQRREPIRGIKRLMFDSMTLSKATIPHFTVGEQACVEHLVTLRKEMNIHLEKKGLKTGYLAFCIKALLPVLKEFPLFNSFYDPTKKEIVFRKDSHIGFAVDSPEGLVVPVLKEAQNKTLLEIIQEIQELSEAVRNGTIQRENLQGASLTLTNLGSLGGLYGTPIINPPEMAILGIYRRFNQTFEKSPNQFESKAFMNFSITCDHRFIDGATAARFLKSFISKVEEPSLLILD